MIKINDLKFKFTFRNDTYLPATMTLAIGDMQIRGFRIMPSKFQDSSKRFYLKPPANRSGNGKWIDIFWTDNKQLWTEIEEAVLQQFEEEHTEYCIETSISESNKDEEWKKDL